MPPRENFGECRSGIERRFTSFDKGRYFALLDSRTFCATVLHATDAVKKWGIATNAFTAWEAFCVFFLQESISDFVFTSASLSSLAPPPPLFFRGWAGCKCSQVKFQVKFAAWNELGAACRKEQEQKKNKKAQSGSGAKKKKKNLSYKLPSFER